MTQDPILSKSQNGPRSMVSAVVGRLLCVLLCLACTAAWTSPAVLFSASKSAQKGSIRASRTWLRAKRSKELIVGLNKYSHDAGCCILDKSGKLLFAQAKERFSRVKHDGGAVGDVVAEALVSIGAEPEDVDIVVSNNHHFRIQPFERQLEWQESLDHVPMDYLASANLLANARHFELSHHLAHAWSCIPVAPFKKGLVLVMDGMGESYKDMYASLESKDRVDKSYMNDLKLLKQLGKTDMVQVPAKLSPHVGYREAESAYLFDGTKLVPVFKRWTRERSPTELFNHGFENMESMGAVYSRVSSHIFGDWNQCGKVMGLAPWADCDAATADEWYFQQVEPGLEDATNLDLNPPERKALKRPWFMRGNPFKEGRGGLQINWKLLESLPRPNEWGDDLFGYYAQLAKVVQSNLEESSMELVRSLKHHTGAENLCLTGGVALNSVMNGKIMQQGMFQNVYIPPFPGDDGIAFGCAMYGLYQLKHRRSTKLVGADKPASVAKRFNIPYTGWKADEEDRLDALNEFGYWVEAIEHEDTDAMIEDATNRLVDGKVIAWHQGRSEIGPRALGARSVLADPRSASIRQHVNQFVKHREWFRPLAPTVLAEDADDWFEGIEGNASPYMSVTAKVKEEKRHEVPGICHVDGTARLQTLTRESNPRYYALLKAFKKKTGCPIVLNTSFNDKGEPIVETAEDAVRTFLRSDGAINRLYMGNFEIRKRVFPLDTAPAVFGTKKQWQRKLEALKVQIRPYYLIQRTASALGETKQIRIMLQTPALKSSASDPEYWEELESDLDADIIELVQQLDEPPSLKFIVDTLAAPPSNQTAGNDGDEEGDDEEYQEADIIEACRRLYDRCLLWFDTGVDNSNR